MIGTDPNSIAASVAQLGSTISLGPQVQLMNQLRQAQLNNDLVGAQKAAYELQQAQDTAKHQDSFANMIGRLGSVDPTTGQPFVGGPSLAAEAVRAGVKPDIAGGYERVGFAPEGPRSPNVVNAQIAAGQPYSATAPASDAELQNKIDIANIGQAGQNQRQQAGFDNAANPFHTPPGATQGGPPLSGPAYLASLPPETAAVVKAISEGRMAFPTGYAMKTPYWQAIINSVAQYDPTFDAVNFGSRAKTRGDFTSGKSAQNITNINQGIAHLGQLADQIAGTASHGGFPFATSVNSVENMYNQGTGDAGITNYNTTRGNVASELTQVFRGAGGAEADINRALGDTDPNGSLDQKVGGVKTLLGLLGSRLSIMAARYNQGMGTTKAPLDILNPQSKAILLRMYKKYGIDPSALQQPAQAMAGDAASSNTAPAEVGGGATPSREEILQELQRRQGAAPQPTAIPLNMGGQ
jgi:hypothetical protein